MLLYPPISSLNARPISIYSRPNQIPNPDTGKTKHLNISWRTESVLQIPNFGAQKYLSKIPENQPPKSAPSDVNWPKMVFPTLG